MTTALSAPTTAAKLASRLKGKDPKTAEVTKPKILIYGAPGVGKTFTSLDWPSVYYIDTEGGANLPHYTDKLKAAGGAYLGPEDGANDFETIIAQMQALASEEHGYRTLVIDSITKPFVSAITAEAERLGDKDAFGASKKPAIALTRRVIDWLDRLPMNVIIIAHERPEWGIDAKGERAQVGITYDAYEKLAYELHLVLHVQKRGRDRVAIVKKSRLTGFPEGETIPWTFNEIAARYGRDVIEKKQAALVLATPEQVRKLQKLIQAVKVEEEVLAKWRTKARVENWSEMTAAQIEPCIAHLEGKLA